MHEQTIAAALAASAATGALAQANTGSQMPSLLSEPESDRFPHFNGS